MSVQVLPLIRNPGGVSIRKLHISRHHLGDDLSFVSRYSFTVGLVDSSSFLPTGNHQILCSIAWGSSPQSFLWSGLNNREERIRERSSLENLDFHFLDKNLAQVEGDEAADEGVMPLQELFYEDEVEGDEATEGRIISLLELLDDDARAEYIELRRLEGDRKLVVPDHSEDYISQMDEELWEGIRQMGGEYRRILEEASARQCLSQSFIARNALRLLGAAAATGMYEDGNGKGDEQMQETSHSSSYNKDKYFWDDLKVTPSLTWEDIGRSKPTEDQPSVECTCCWAWDHEILRAGNSSPAHV